MQQIIWMLRIQSQLLPIPKCQASLLPLLISCIPLTQNGLLNLSKSLTISMYSVPDYAFGSIVASARVAASAEAYSFHPQNGLNQLLSVRVLLNQELQIQLSSYPMLWQYFVCMGHYCQSLCFICNIMIQDLCGVRPLTSTGSIWKSRWKIGRSILRSNMMVSTI